MSEVARAEVLVERIAEEFTKGRGVQAIVEGFAEPITISKAVMHAGVIGLQASDERVLYVVADALRGIVVSSAKG